MRAQNDHLFVKHDTYYSFILVAVFCVLAFIGLANLYSASYGGIYFGAQLKHLVIGAFLFVLFGWFIPLRIVNAYAYPLTFFVVVSLVVVLVLGHTAGGAQRWMSLGPFKFQPSEIAKLAMTLMIAKYFYNHKSKSSYTLKELYPLFVPILLIFALIFKQPDFGTAGVCLMIACSQLIFVDIRIKLKTIVYLGIGGILMGFVGWHFLLERYQKLRILNLLNPTMDPSGSGYNALQSLVAIGSGHQFGKGFMQGTQTQLRFLPARHTDFIFSVFAEEHGFWGGAFVFFLFAVIAYVSLEIARNARDSFGSLLSLGIGALIFIEFVINVAMVLGMFPVVGIPLPFFSYGGTTLMTICLCMGLLVSIDRDSARAYRRQMLGQK